MNDNSAARDPLGSAEEVKKAAMVKVLVGAHVLIEPNISSWCRRSAEDEAREFDSWCKEFMAFLKDHRSQDVNGVEVVREYEERCSLCEKTWELDYEDWTCSYCGAPAERTK